MKSPNKNIKNRFTTLRWTSLTLCLLCGRYKYVRIALSIILVSLLSGCGKEVFACESKFEAFQISNAYVFGKADKLSFQKAFFAEFESKDTEVKYLGECVHEVTSLVVANDIDKPQRVMSYTAVMKRVSLNGNWKLHKLQVKDTDQKLLLNENHDL